MVVFFQSDYGLVVLHISRNGHSGTTDRVLQDAIDKVCYVCNERTYPVRVGTLTYGPLQNVWLLDAFQKTLECGCVRDQARFVEISSTAIERAVVELVPSWYFMSKYKSIAKIKFKSCSLIWENLTEFQYSGVWSRQSEVVSGLDWSVALVSPYTSPIFPNYVLKLRILFVIRWWWWLFYFLDRWRCLLALSFRW